MDEITITDFQKKRILERIKLNFNEELQKSESQKSRKSFSKIFRKELDILIHQFYRDGIQFYGFTIDMLYLDKTDPEMWQKVHENVEYWISELGQKVELIEFCYLSLELKKPKISNNQASSEIKSLVSISRLNEIPYLYGIVGVRTILGENDFLDLQMKKIFRSYSEVEDIIISKLDSIEKITNYWNFIIKENNFKFHRFTQYSDHLKYIDIYGSISDLELIYDAENDDHSAFGLDLSDHSKTYQITGIKMKNPDSKTLIIYLLNLFLCHKNLKVNKNNVYKILPNTKYSFELIYSLETLKKNNIDVFECLKRVYPQQLEEINTMEIINKDWNKTLDEIIINNNYLPGVKFKADAIEFKDGVYIITENKFFAFNDKIIKLGNKMAGLNICIYFDKKYKNLKLPIKWLKSIKVSSKEIFCINLAKTFNKKLNVEINNKLNKYSVFKDILFDLGENKKTENEVILNEKFFIEEELAEIIIYCNRLYFKSKRKK